MSDRRKRVGVTNKMVAYIAAAVIHLIVIGLVVFNYSFKDDYKEVDPFDAEKIDTVKASVIDDRKVEEQMEAIKEKDRQKKEQERLERERLEKLKQDAQKEQERIEELQEKKKQEQAAAEELEAQRKAIALKKKQEEEAEKKRQEELKKKRAEEEKKRKAEEAKRQRELAEKRKREAAEQARREQEEADRRRLVEQLEAEERAAKQQEADRRAGERTTTVLNKYSALIERAIKAKWRVAPGTERWRSAKVNIKLSPLGEVEGVRIVESSGLQSFDESIETAVLQANPLPFPTPEEDQAAHRELQNINLTIDLRQ